MVQAGQTALERLHKQSISAKDIASQFWCEKQMELFATHKYSTTQMAKGSAIHNALQQEVFVPLTVEPLSYSDRLYKTAYENSAALSRLLGSKMAREIRVYSSINGYSLVGQIDELRLEESSIVIVENKTTDAGRELNSVATIPHAVQIMLYKKMLEDLRQRSYTYENFTLSFKLGSKQLTPEFVKGLRTLNIKDEYLNLESIFKKMFTEFQSLPKTSDLLEIHYFDRQSGELAKKLEIRYDAERLSSQLVYAMRYWTGEREAQPVSESEKWKCRSCKFFGNECKVWWT